MIIHEHVPRRKKSKPTAKQRALKAEWEALVDRYKPKKRIEQPVAKYTSPKVPEGRSTRSIKSLDSGIGVAAAPAQKVYTGDKMLGISSTHKSNLIPVFSKEHAEDISKMRR